MNPQNKHICSMRPQYIQICFVCVCNTNRYVCVWNANGHVVWVCNENRYIVWIHNTTDMLYEPEIKPTFCISLHTNRFALWFYITNRFLVGTQNKNTHVVWVNSANTKVLCVRYTNRHIVWVQYEQTCCMRAPDRHTCWNRMYLELLAKGVPSTISPQSQAIVICLVPLWTWW